jgi:cell division septation protein DedD
LQSDIESAAGPADVELPGGRPRTTLDLAAAKLRTALLERSGYVVVTADSADAAEALFAAVEPRLKTFRTVRASGRTLDPEAIVRALWRDGEPPFPARLAMRTLLDEARAAAEPIVVAITDADVADAGQLERVRLTLEGAPDASEIIHVALLGGPELIDVLRRPEARPIALRIGATVQVPQIAAELVPLSLAPTARTLTRRRLAIVAVVTVAVGLAWLATLSPERLPPPTPPATAPEPAPDLAAPAVPAAEQGAASRTPEPAPALPAPTVAAETLEPPTNVPAAPVPPPAAIEPRPTVEEPAPVATVHPSSQVSDLALQVGAFVRAESAAALRTKLAARFPDVTVSPITRGGVTYHRVRVGGFTSTRARDAALQQLRAAGYAPAPLRD